jgi:hypothetical protein
LTHKQDVQSAELQINALKQELELAKKDLKYKFKNEADLIWEKIEIQYTEKPVYQAHLDAKNSADIMHSALNDFKAKLILVNDEHARITGMTPQVKVKLESLEAEIQKNQKICSEQLDNLGLLVNNMEEHYKRGLPEHLKNISMTTDMNWASPTLLCLKLKDEFVRLQNEHEVLKSQLSEESNSYITANNDLKDQVRTLNHSLSDISTKFNKEKDEKEKIMQLIQGQDKEAFDAIRFHSVLEDNGDLKMQVKNLKDQLITEKHIKLNQLYEDQDAVSKILTLNHELNTLGNIKLELMDQIQTIRSANELQLSERDRQVQFLQQENRLLADKLVSSVLYRIKP